jgi:hypothetical protein
LPESLMCKAFFRVEAEVERGRTALHCPERLSRTKSHLQHQPIPQQTAGFIRRAAVFPLRCWQSSIVLEWSSADKRSLERHRWSSARRTAISRMTTDSYTGRRRLLADVEPRSYRDEHFWDPLCMWRRKSDQFEP